MEIYNTPIIVKEMMIKNRFVMAPIYINKQIYEESYQNFYVDRAKGNVGLIIAPIPTYNGLLDLENPKFIDGYKKIIDSCSQYNCQIILQVFSGNGKDVNIMSKSDLESIPYKFSRVARVLKNSGFKGMEIHGAHHSLFMHLLSPATNFREDNYGGRLENRIRLQLKTIKEIRNETGEDFSLFFRFSANDLSINGGDINETLFFAVELEKAGIDVLDVSVGGTLTSPKNSECPGKDDLEGCFSEYSKIIKTYVKSPVICVGKINTIKTINTILSNNKADFVAIGRHLIADKYYVKKLIEFIELDYERLNDWYNYLPE